MNEKFGVYLIDNHKVKSESKTNEIESAQPHANK